MTNMTSAVRLEPIDDLLVRIYIVSCTCQWDKLAPLAKELYAAGGTIEQLRGCLRHLVVLAGYGPCLAATLTLQKAKLLPGDTPAKVGGPPGDAFDLVYTTMAPAVRRKVHSADPALGAWIQSHLYGDIYSSPGIDLRRKQMLMCARLAQADMGEQLFGHALAAMRFGVTEAQLNAAIGVAFELVPGDHTKVHTEALKILGMTAAKYEKDYAGAGISCPEVTVPHPSLIKVPLYEDGASWGGYGPPQIGTSHAEVVAAAPQSTAPVSQDTTKVKHEEGRKNDVNESTLFVWEELDSRIDPSTGTWREKKPGK